MEFNYPLDMTRKEALVRRANRLIDWLHREEYSKYVDEASVNNLKRLIKRIIWALEQSLDEAEWREFLLLFQESRKILTVENEDEQEAAYNETIASLISSLETYRGFVEDMED